MRKQLIRRQVSQKTKQLVCILFIGLGLFLLAGPAFSQQSAAYTNARDKLVKILKKRTIDENFTRSIDQFYYASCDSLLASKAMVEDRPIEVVLTRLFDACENKLNSRLITILRIPSVNNSFLLTLTNYNKQPLLSLYRDVGITQSAILEFAFDGLKLGDSIRTFVGIREMLNNPYYISNRLQQARFTPYQDTLLYYLANSEPAVLYKKLADKDELFTKLVKNSQNRTVKAVSQIEKDIYYDQVLPFGMAILEGRITADSIRKLALVPPAYYRAFIDETTRLHTSPDAEIKAYLKQPIAELNNKLANKYFISEINHLHESPDKQRYEVLNTLKPAELYFILLGGSGELYTSSFLYLYKKFIKGLGKDGLNKFLADINYDRFDQFISNVLEYGLVNDLVDQVEEEKFAGLIGSYFKEISSRQSTDNQIILNAMSTSELLNEIRNRQQVRTILVAELENLEKGNQNDIMLQRMFAGFKDILQDKADFKSDATYDVLPVQRLLKNNSIVQVGFFYDDEDGSSSFSNSLASYSPALWEKEEKENYIILKSRKGNNMGVYMNKPMTKGGSDSAQDEMLRDIEAAGYEPSSFIHRGHSYHLYQSLRKIQPGYQFVFLGSCGGYSEVLKVFRQNPDVNIIVTRNIGSKLINDPLLQRVNMDLVNNKDINWNEVWAEFDAKFQAKLTKDLFSSYIPPNRYVGVKFIRKVFNF